MSKPVNHFYDFGSFRLDPIKRCLLRDGEVVSLTPKAFDTLLVLLERRGQTLTKDELMQQVWQDVAVEENNLTQNISTLRKVLGDGNGNGQYIVTIPKQGYRFVAEVTEVGEAAAPDSATDKPEALQGVATASAAAAQLLPANADESLTQPAVKAQPKTTMILFAIGFVSAVLLVVWLAFNLPSKTSFKANKVNSIAVLPVKPITTASRDELYEVGIADSLILRLNAMQGLIVRPLSATRRYSDLNQDPLAAGKEQQVDYVLAANYQLLGGKIRFTAQLFNVASGQIEQVFKGEKEAGDVFAVQDVIAGDIGNQLQARFGTPSTILAAKRGTTNEEAYRLYLHGKNLTARRSAADAQKAIETFEQAIRLDPNFARAYAGLASAYSSTATLRGGDAPRDQFEKATAAVAKALELDNTLSEAYVSRGSLQQTYQRDWEAAEKDLLRAIELEPNNDSAHGGYAGLLARSGRFDEAMTEIELALAIDPGSLSNQRDRGRYLYFARRYDEAIVQLKRALEVDKNFLTAYGWLWQAYEMKGDYAGAYEWFMRGQKHRTPENVEPLQKAYKTSGWQGVKQKQLEIEKQKENQPSGRYFTIARFCALLGDKEQAFAYLHKAIEKGESQPVMLKVEPAFDSLRGDPRFDELLKRVGFK